MSNVIAFNPRSKSVPFVYVDGGVDHTDPEKPFLYFVTVHMEDGSESVEWCGRSYGAARASAEATRQAWGISRAVVDYIDHGGGAA